MIKISFIIVEYYSIKDIVDCYSSVVSQIPCNWSCEVIVSSNSTYSFKQQNEFKSKYKELKWLFNEKNGGFAYAMNQGLAMAVGDILVVMNPDVRLKSGVENMLDYMCSHCKIGIIAPQIINSRGEVQDSFRNFITPANFIQRHVNRILGGVNLVKTDKSPCVVDWVIGAFMMMSRNAYKVVKELDEHYFLYCEDMDLCTRMYQKGFEVVYYPDAMVEYEGTRSARKSLKYAWIFLHSLFRYWKKFGLFVNRS